MQSIRTARRGRLAAALLAAFVVAACNDEPAGPTLDISRVTGAWNMTALSFDPQGSLPNTAILQTLGETPQLTLTSDNAAQILFRDPVTTLFITVNGTFRTTADGVRIDFNANSQYRQLLLSRRMEFVFNGVANTLTFAADSPDGVDRARLIALVPAWANEQLLSPVPGALTVRFTRVGS